MIKYGNNKGFTLIELIITLCIITIIFSIAIPIVNINRLNLIAFSRTIRNDLREIRYIKMTEGKDYSILLSQDYYYVVEGNKAIRKIELDKGIGLRHNFSKNRLEFHLNGTPIMGGGTVKIFNKNNNEFCEITVVPDTGRILFKEKVIKVEHDK